MKFTTSVTGSVDLHHKVVGEAPECVGIDNLKYLLAVLLNNLIRAFGLVGKHLGLLAVQVDDAELALVGRNEESLVEVALEELGLAQETGLEDVVLLKLLG